MSKEIKNNKEAETLADFIKTLKYGATIPHETIENIISVSYIEQKSKYNSIVTKAKKLLLPYGICLESIRGQGYQLVDPNDFTNYALKSYNHGFNAIKKGYKILDNAPVEHMSEEGRTTYRRVYDRAITLNATIKGAAIELRTLGQRKHPFALENRN